jgi:hypothetical protein
MILLIAGLIWANYQEEKQLEHERRNARESDMEENH